jgi:hypothetical protein
MVPIRKIIFAVLALLFFTSVISAQDTKRVILSPKSTISTSEIAEGFEKACPNVLVTEDPAKADYVLEAAENVRFSNGDSMRQWHFTLLSKDGDVLFTTHPKVSFHKYEHHFKDTCEFINGKKKKK